MSQAESQEPVAEVTWEAPEEIRTRYDWHAIAEQLRGRPGQWAKVFDDDRASIVNAIRQGSVRVLAPELGFQTRTRNNVRYPVRKCSLYMRWSDPAQKGS